MAVRAACHLRDVLRCVGVRVPVSVRDRGAVDLGRDRLWGGPHCREDRGGARPYVTALRVPGALEGRRRRLASREGWGSFAANLVRQIDDRRSPFRASLALRRRTRNRRPNIAMSPTIRRGLRTADRPWSNAARASRRVSASRKLSHAVVACQRSSPKCDHHARSRLASMTPRWPACIVR
jgi:hypothetical protein